MFEINKEELENLRSQFGISSWGGTGYAPLAFTGPCVAMLSSVLNSPMAIKVNNQIIRVFTEIRQVLADNQAIKFNVEEIKRKLSDQGKGTELVFDYLDELIKKNESAAPRKQIGYNSQ